MKQCCGQKRCRDEETHVSPRKKCKSDLPLSLYIRWFSNSGKTRVNHLNLKSIAGIDTLEGLAKNLVNRAFPVNQRPDHLVSDDFYRFTPTEEFMSLPGEIARTEYRVVVHHDGWEYTILQDSGSEDADSKLLVTDINFESATVLFGNVGVRVSLIAYPVISIRRDVLDELEDEILSNPDFNGYPIK